MEIQGTDWRTVIRNLSRGELHPFYEKIWRALYSHVEWGGDSVFEEYWDNLLVLDACRYDIFKEENTIPGNLEKKVSVASKTVDWIDRTFTDHPDIVYVTSNPVMSDEFFDTSSMFHKVYKNYLEDETEEGKIPPEVTAEAAREAMANHPDKRLIVHFVSPHDPYIGDIKGWLRDLYYLGMDVESAYRSELNRTLRVVEELVSEMEGATVITADHAELIYRERGCLGHPSDIYFPELVEVPWFEPEM